MENDSENIISWGAEIHIHTKNFNSVPTEARDRFVSKNDFYVFSFTSLEITRFYELYRIAHKWSRTIIVVNDERFAPSEKITQVFRCCYDANSWPNAQNDLRKKTGREVKQLSQKHYCYGYDRTIHSIVGCQQIKVARDTNNGWMNRQFVKAKNGVFVVNVDKLLKVIGQEFRSGPQYCPFMAANRIPSALKLVEQYTKALQDFWTMKAGSLQPKPIEYYFDMKYNDTVGSRFSIQCSLVYYKLLSSILEFSLYKSVLQLAIENPALGIIIDFSGNRKNRTYVNFDRVKELEEIIQHEEMTPRITDIHKSNLLPRVF